MDVERASTDLPLLPGQLTAFWTRQAAEWPALAEGIAALGQARTRSFDLAGARIVALCNPARIASASAKVDAEALARRPCFLCPEQRPAVQRALAYRDDWLILCNPAPIFDPHFTVAHVSHRPQLLGPALGTLLDLARDLDGALTVFYNGPGSGASAPDHLHLQATPAGAMPFEIELAEELAAGDRAAHPRGIDWLDSTAVRVGLTRAHLRPAVVFVGQDRAELIRQIERVVHVLGDVRPATPEPRFNLYATFTDERWIAWLFPRAAHRPACYGTGPDDYLISPGAIDLGGVLITPRPADLDRLTAATVRSILNGVLLSPGVFARLRERLATVLGE